MATYVNDLRLKEIGTGESSGTWGTETNTNLELIGEALGYATEGITTNADTHATTVADGSTDPGRAMYIKYTGTLDSACTITIGPNTMTRVHLIENATSGSQNIIIKQGSGAEITIPNGFVKAVYLDGAGSGAAVTEAFDNLSVGTNFRIGNGAAEDTSLVFDGNAQDFYIGLDDSADDLVIGLGSTVGTTPAISVDEDQKVTLPKKLTVDGADGAIDNDYVAFLRNQEATDDRNFGLYLVAGSTSSDVAFRIDNQRTGGGNAFHVNGDGKILVNHSASVSQAGVAPTVQVHGTGSATSSISATRNSNDTGGPYLILSKSRGTSTGAVTVVQDDDILGQIMFAGADGGDLAPVGASIQAFVDGTPGTNDMPGRLVFSTTADGAEAATERLRIQNSGITQFKTGDAHSGIAEFHTNSGTGSTSGYISFHPQGTVRAYIGTGSSLLSGAAVSDFIFRSEADLVLNSGGNSESVRLDSNGHVTMPKQPAFSAQVGTQTLNIATNASRNTVGFTTEIFDNNADYNASASTFTAPVAGRYQLNTIVYVNDSDAEATYIRVEIRTSNRDYTFIFEPNYSADRVRDSFSLSVLADMDASDTALVDIGQFEGTAQMDIPVSAQSNFSGYLVA